jgi:hypothetical protein
MTGFIKYITAREVADFVYGSPQGQSLPRGWELDSTFNPDGLILGTGISGELNLGSGFYAYALKPTAANISVPNTRILAFRGTEFTLSTISDLYADADSIGGAQFTDAARVVNQWLAENLVNQNHIDGGGVG